MYKPATNFTASYNGYSFSPLMETLDVRIVPVEDAAKRTVAYSIFRFILKDHLTTGDLSTQQLTTAGGTIDSAFQTIRQQLTSQGGQFIYTNKGLGNLNINVGSGGTRDVIWGPRCKELAWKLDGPGNAAEFTWQCEVAIPDCVNASFAGALMEFCYKLIFSIDKSGYTRRTYAGFLRIPMTRKSQSSRTLPDTADAYREKISPPLVPGFRRIPGDFTVDESKTRLDFSIVDEEMGPQPLPRGVVDCRARFNVTSTDVGLVQYIATLTASYEMSKKFNRSDAWTSFAELARDRISWTSQQSKQKVAIPIHFSLGEPDIFGRESAEFSLSWRFIDSLQSVLANSGIWRPVPNTDFTTWQSSLANILGPRGGKGVKHLANSELIVDLCQPQSQPSFSTLRSVPLDQLQRTLRTSGISFGNPPPRASWIRYDMRAEVNPRDGHLITTALPYTNVLKTGGSFASLVGGGLAGAVGGGGLSPSLTTLPGFIGGALGGGVAGVLGDLGSQSSHVLAADAYVPGSTWGPLPGGGYGWIPPPDYQPPDNPFTGGQGGQAVFLPLSPVQNFGGGGATPALAYAVTNVPPAKVQLRGAPKIYITLIGWAIRAGYPIDPPVLTRVGDAVAVPANGRYHGFRQGVIGNYAVPLFLAEWCLRWRLLTPPNQGIATPANPIFN